MKKFIKDNLKVITAFVLGVIISGMTVYGATVSFNSGDVQHTKSDNTTTTVQAALNDLYTIHNSGTATASQILKNKTAFANGSLLTGTMNDYSSSTAQTCTKANTSSKLYIKPANNGYYTTNSSFNTGINYNPKGTGGTASTSGTSVTSTSTNVTLNGSDLTLESGSKITIPAGYYSSAINVSNGGTTKLASLPTYFVGYKSSTMTLTAPGNGKVSLTASANYDVRAVLRNVTQSKSVITPYTDVYTNIVTISFKKNLSFETVVAIKDSLVNYRGSDPLVFKTEDEKGNTSKILASANFWLNANNDLVQNLEKQFGQDLEVSVNSLE